MTVVSGVSDFWAGRRGRGLLGCARDVGAAEVGTWRRRDLAVSIEPVETTSGGQGSSRLALPQRATG